MSALILHQHNMAYEAKANRHGHLLINIKGVKFQMETIKLFDSAYEQYHRLTEKLELAIGIQEQMQIFRRLTNHLNEMESLLTGSELP